MAEINTNLSSLVVQKNLNKSTKLLNQAMENLSSGFRINSAKDGAVNFVKSSEITTTLEKYNVASENIAMGVDMLSTAEGILEQIQDKADRLYSLSLQARNGTYDGPALDAINNEAKSIVEEIGRLYDTAEYNGLKLFSKEAEIEIPDYLPKAGKSGFIAEVVQDTPEVVVTEPTQLKSAIQNNTKIGIANAETLAQLATLVNSGTSCSGKTIILTEDIDLSAYSNWKPIGNSNTSFEGNFNGNGHKIKNLTINRPTEYFVGLFGYTYSDSKIENVGLENVSVKGSSYVGGLAGRTLGDVSNCYVTGLVTGENNSTGGLIGEINNYIYQSTNVIENCYAEVSVKGGGNAVGGFAGDTSHGPPSTNLIKNCYSTGNVEGQVRVGGFIGDCLDPLENCYATGDVLGDTYVGGFLGGRYNSTLNINNCMSKGNVTGNKFVGGFIGVSENDSSIITLSGIASYGQVQGLDKNSTGSFVGGSVVENYNHFGTLEIIDSTVLAQDSAIIGGAYYGNEPYYLLPNYDMSTMLAWIEEIDKPVGIPAISIQTGMNSGDYQRVEVDTNFQYDLSVLEDGIESDEALNAILDLIDVVSVRTTSLGAVGNRLEGAIDTLDVGLEKLAEARSTLRDSDVAKESSKYIQQQIFQQANATLLSTANQIPSLALQML